MPLQHTLIIYEETGEREITLTLPTYVLGRNKACNIHLTCSFVDQWHATLERIIDAEGCCSYLILDGEPGVRRSRNGSFVNGIKVEQYVLQDGDVLTIGQVEMLYRVHDIKHQESGHD
jgi:pSer/pThr/pTyr-binding forkhead associated (FHA) protein